MNKSEDLLLGAWKQVEIQPSNSGGSKQGYVPKHSHYNM